MQMFLSIFAVASFPIAVLVIVHIVSRDVDRIVEKAEERSRLGNSGAKR